MRTVDELVDQHERAGAQLRLERAASRKRDQIGHAGALENVDIGAVVDVAWRQPVALVVAREKDDRQPADLAGQQRARRLAPRACDALGLRIGQPRQVVDARPADNSQNRLCHIGSFFLE